MQRLRLGQICARGLLGQVEARLREPDRSELAFRGLQSARRWRCGLSAAERQRLGVGANWRCNDVNVFVERVGVDQFDRARANALTEIPTRFQLPQQSVDLLIEAGAEVVRNNPTYQAFRRGL